MRYAKISLPRLRIVLRQMWEEGAKANVTCDADEYKAKRAFFIEDCMITLWAKGYLTEAKRPKN